MEAAALTIGATVYQGFVSRAVYNLYDTLGSSIKHPAIQNVLAEVTLCTFPSYQQLDIAVHLDVIEALMKEIPDNSSEAVKICLTNIEHVIMKIQEVLVDVTTQTAHHNTKVSLL
jgi:hypothetical protein